MPPPGRSRASAGTRIVSKDNDFRQYAFLYGPPPKVVWLSVGNAGTTAIVRLLKARIATLLAFERDPEQSLLVLEEQPPDQRE